jgi:hypothetical protein
MDMLVEQTHEVRHEWRNNERPMRFTDTRLDEQQRAVSLKMVPMSLLLESSTGKSFLMNLIDTPGTPLALAHAPLNSVPTPVNPLYGRDKLLRSQNGKWSAPPIHVPVAL